MNNQMPTSSKRVPKPRRAESGQAIILMALVLVALLGMLGLAIDGGGLYFLWRDAQNASDAAVLTASYARCTKKGTPTEVQTAVIAAGLEAAATNGFNNNGTSNTVMVSNPPVSGPKVGNPDYIQVDITATKPSYFIQLVYRAPLQVTTHAVGYCSPPFDPSAVPGLWAGSTSCLNTVKWGGSTSTIIGPMYSNYQMQFTGSSVTLQDGEIEARDDIQAGDNVHPDLPDYPLQEYMGVPPMGDPLHLDESLYMQGGAVFENVAIKHYLFSPTGSPDPDFKVHTSSTYDALWSPGGNRTLEGLYYVRGDVTLGTGIEFGPAGVTIIAEGTIDFAGGSQTHFYEVKDANGKVIDGVTKPTENGVQYPGVMLASYYDGPCGSSHAKDGIKIPGPHTVLYGVFYAPKSGVGISGSSVEIHGSLITDNVDYQGSDGLLQYDPSILPPRPPSVQVAE